MHICRFCRNPAAGCSVYQTVLQKIRLINIFNGTGIFPKRSCQGLKADRPAPEILYDRQQHVSVCIIQSKLINFKKIQRLIGYLLGYHAILRTYLCKVTHALEHTVCQSGSSTAATR